MSLIGILDRLKISRWVVPLIPGDFWPPKGTQVIEEKSQPVPWEKAVEPQVVEKTELDLVKVAPGVYVQRGGMRRVIIKKEEQDD